MIIVPMNQLLILLEHFEVRVGNLAEDRGAN